jgi:NAD(P)-dependent dehydrogenase (short-subunit alcohol dehydrogenase family)
VTPEELRDLFDMRGRVALVTGGTRGIGRAIAGGFAAAGARVVVASRKPEACQQAAKEIIDGGGEAIGLPTHMGDIDAVRRLVAITAGEFGGIDIVVNNAANALTMPTEQITEDAWDKSYAVNLKGPVFLCAAALPHLCESSHAAVVNILSVGAITYAPNNAMYSGAKAALFAFTRNLAAEWADRGIRVNALAPGTVDTDMVRNTGPEAVERMRQISWQKRIARPDEMVGPALFLASDAASYVTGQLLIADGGYAVAR